MSGSRETIVAKQNPFSAKLKATADGDGTLLDHSAILYGSALSDGNAHSNTDLPLVVAGHAGGLRGAPPPTRSSRRTSSHRRLPGGLHCWPREAAEVPKALPADRTIQFTSRFQE